MEVIFFVRETRSELDVRTEFQEKRIAKMRRMTGELIEDKSRKGLQIRAKIFNVKLSPLHDLGYILVTQVDERLNDFRSTVTNFYRLDPSQISEENKESFRNLC